MTRPMLLLSIVAVTCLRPSLPVQSQEPANQREVLARVTEAEFNVEMHQMELKMAELAVGEAQVELEKIKLQLELAQNQGNSHQVGHVKLESKQAAIRVEMRKLQSEMARLQIARARAELESLRSAMIERPREPSRAQLEYLEDLGIIVIRGEKTDVERIKALIGGVEKKKKENE